MATTVRMGEGLRYSCVANQLSLFVLFSQDGNSIYICRNKYLMKKNQQPQQIDRHSEQSGETASSRQHLTVHKHLNRPLWGQSVHRKSLLYLFAFCSALILFPVVSLYSNSNTLEAYASNTIFNRKTATSTSTPGTTPSPTDTSTPGTTPTPCTLIILCTTPTPTTTSPTPTPTPLTTPTPTPIPVTSPTPTPCVL